MTFDVQSIDLEQLANVATTGGIEALEELAVNGKVATPAPEAPTEVDPKEAEAIVDPAAADPEPAAKETPTPPAAEPEKEHANAVSTKDGKGTIPYSVLKGARERAIQAEQAALVLKKQVEELTERMEATANPDSAPKVDPAGAVGTQIEAMRAKAAELAGEFPEMAALLTGQIELLQVTHQQLGELKGKHEASEADRTAREQAASAETVQEAIDGNPVLSFWAEKAGAEYDAASEIDQLLRSKPEWQGIPYSERFTKVVEMVRVMHPEYEVPATDPAPGAKPAEPGASTEVKAPATPSDKRPPVNSLSDIPGGVPQVDSKREQVEAMSGSALGNRFMTMTNEQMTEYLSSLAM